MALFVLEVIFAREGSKEIGQETQENQTRWVSNAFEKGGSEVIRSHNNKFIRHKKTLKSEWLSPHISHKQQALLKRATSVVV
jgi:hypothetical protein